MTDYSLLDHWCQEPTWYTDHAYDNKRRSEALKMVIDHPDFHPADAAAYVAENHGKPIMKGKEAEMREAIDRFRKLAEQGYRRRGGVL